MNFRNLVLCSLLTLVPTTVLSQVESEEQVCDQSDKVKFEINDIFDLSDPETIFLHHWANFLHINTKPITLLNESAFFVKKCDISQDDLLELERHLRQRKYIREAIVVAEESNKIKVTTYDNWSLMPTVDYSRRGGFNKYSFGLKERNLLGLGISAEFEYHSNDQRSGYKLKSHFPLFLNKNINASIRLTNNDDGSSESFFVNKDFVSFDTLNAFNFGFDNHKQIDTQYQNGLDVAHYNHDKSISTAQWQWLFKNTHSETIRYGIGYTQEKHLFSELSVSFNTFQSQFLPQNREQSYPFLNIEYLQKDYRKFTNFNLINQIEDFNMGWHIKMLIGKDFSNNALSPDLLWRTYLSKGLQTSSSAYLFFNAKYDGEIHDSDFVNNRYLLTFYTEYFHKINESWAAYIKNANTFSKSPYLDQAITIGDDTGVRGFPLQYQRGSRTSQLTIEVRYYPHISIYKLFELGGAAFIDTGKAFGESPVENNNSSILTSVGLGARFYSTHSSDAQVIHVDLVKPISTDVNVNSFEFRVTTKHSF